MVALCFPCCQISTQISLSPPFWPIYQTKKVTKLLTIFLVRSILSSANMSSVHTFWVVQWMDFLRMRSLCELAFYRPCIPLFRYKSQNHGPPEGIKRPFLPLETNTSKFTLCFRFKELCLPASSRALSRYNVHRYYVPRHRNPNIIGQWNWHYW